MYACAFITIYIVIAYFVFTRFDCFTIRIRDAARLLHTRGSKANHHWSGIRADRLSSHHGEFCKLFCSHTSRELDFFDESGARSGEQLLNMIGMCKAFSPGQDNNCSVFLSLFDIKPDRHQAFKSALAALRQAAVGRDVSNETKEVGVKDLRNRMFHDFLTLSTPDFEALVACSKQLLSSICMIISCIAGDHQSDYAEQALAEIDSDAGIVRRDLIVAKLCDEDQEVMNRTNKQMLEELERMQDEMITMKMKLGSHFKSFAVCLKDDIEEHLIASMCGSRHCTCSTLLVYNYIRQSNRQNRQASLSS